MLSNIENSPTRETMLAKSTKQVHVSFQTLDKAVTESTGEERTRRRSDESGVSSSDSIGSLSELQSPDQPPSLEPDSPVAPKIEITEAEPMPTFKPLRSVGFGFPNLHSGENLVKTQGNMAHLDDFSITGLIRRDTFGLIQFRSTRRRSSLPSSFTAPVFTHNTENVVKPPRRDTLVLAQVPRVSVRRRSSLPVLDPFADTGYVRFESDIKAETLVRPQHAKTKSKSKSSRKKQSSRSKRKQERKAHKKAMVKEEKEKPKEEDSVNALYAELSEIVGCLDFDDSLFA
ncbi:MAG: hypothetical protein SGCHY_004376 [Lobulomycetales sp.]